MSVVEVVLLFNLLTISFSWSEMHFSHSANIEHYVRR